MQYFMGEFGVKQVREHSMEDSPLTSRSSHSTTFVRF